MCVQLLPRRTIDSVFLEDKHDVLRRVRAFLSPDTKRLYVQLQKPYRIAFLLHGTPGSGKTSLVHMIASEVNANIYYLSLSNPMLNSENLSTFLAKVPDGNIILLEDVDAAFKSRRRNINGAAGDDDDDVGGDISLSTISIDALLNVLDGLVAFTGTMLFMTTNHREKLEQIHSALLRHGRVDKFVQFSPPNPTNCTVLPH